MPPSPKTIVQSNIKMEAKSANSTSNDNTIFNFPSVDDGRNCDLQSANGMNCTTNMRHHEGKEMDVTDVNVNVNVVVASSSLTNHQISSSMSSSDPFTNNTTTNQSSNSVNVINVCGGGDRDFTNNQQIANGGIIITDESNDLNSNYYDAIKLEDNGTTTAIIYETIVIENTPQNQELMGLMSVGNNNKLIANKNVSLDTLGNHGGGIIVLTGSLNDLLLNQNLNVLTNASLAPSVQGDGIFAATTKCLNDVKTNPNPIQSIVLNLNSQSSSAPTSMTSTSTAGQVSGANQKSILTINSNHQQQPHQHHQQQVKLCYEFYKL